MPLPTTVGTARVLLPRTVITVSAPTSGIVNESAEPVFNESAEGLSGP